MVPSVAKPVRWGSDKGRVEVRPHGLRSQLYHLGAVKSEKRDFSMPQLSNVTFSV